MKNFTTLLLLLIVGITTSCSNSDDENAANSPDYFNCTLNGQAVNIDSVAAQKTGSSISVKGFSRNNWEIIVNFNKYGNMGDVAAGIFPASIGLPIKRSYHYYKSNYFDFELVSIDQARKKVKVTFSGRIYDNEYDNTGDYDTVEGSFQVTYAEVTPVVPGLHMSAKIDGLEWQNSDIEDTSGFSEDGNTILKTSNDTKYTLGIVTNHLGSTVGDYTFSPADVTNKVILYEFDSATRRQVEYSSTNGNMKLTSKTVGPEYTIIEGTFSFTAIHPVTGAAVSITNGSFKERYDNTTGRNLFPFE